MEQIDPSLLLVDRNVRRDAAPDKTLVESVRDLGVLVPIVAVRTDAGVRVRYGHRRTHAAIQAGQATVPVWVFDTDHADSDTDRIVAQWAENEHRAALTATDRLAAVEQLSAFGVSAAQITKRLKTKRTQVDAALAVAASPLAKKATERYEFLTLDQAAVLAEFDAGDDADTLRPWSPAPRTAPVSSPTSPSGPATTRPPAPASRPPATPSQPAGSPSCPVAPPPATARPAARKGCSQTSPTPRASR